MEGTTGGGDGGGVRVVSRRMVRPLIPPPPPPPMTNGNSYHHPRPEEEEVEVIHLTPWDLRMISIDYIQKGILLPKPPAGTGGDVLVNSLASSFARVLRLFYPFAGRLATDERGDGTVAVSLRCTGEGAELVHAVAPGVAVADIVSTLRTPPVISDLYPLALVLGADAAIEKRDCESHIPVLSAQVTELDDGVFIGMTLNHSVGDGTKFWHFFNTWSEINRRGLSSSIGDDLSSAGRALVTSSSPRFNVFGNDFGWGRPLAVTPLDPLRPSPDLTNNNVLHPAHSDPDDVAILVDPYVVPGGGGGRWVPVNPQPAARSGRDNGIPALAGIMAASLAVNAVAAGGAITPVMAFGWTLVMFAGAVVAMAGIVVRGARQG